MAERTCKNCRHYGRDPWLDPCDGCVSDGWLPKWEAAPAAEQASASRPIEPPNGLTNREWFAGMAMAAFIPSSVALNATGPTWPVTLDEIAEKAFAMADAMLKAGEG